MRKSGILLHITSLPSPHGIGTMGREAFAFAEFLHAARQRYWQMLPLGPTGFGDSPYQSFSSFAGNPYLIDLTLLTEDGLLSPGEADAADWGNDARRVDYNAIFRHRYALLRRAYRRGYARDAAQVDAFMRENAHWLPDYALFMALKAHFSMRAWMEWEDADIRLRKPEALVRYRELLFDDIQFHAYVQYLFFSQWAALKAYCGALNISLIGDLPIYVALDSADVWARPENYLLDEARRPAYVAGVPPDYFSATGQLWGNPIYDWAHMREDGYAWWMRRIEASAGLFDVLRIDHFRGLESYWRVPYGNETAQNGEWVRGPGPGFVQTLKGNFPNLPIIAEDLGFLTEDVHALLKSAGYPGMRVLQFAFDSREESRYLPHTYEPHCVCYTGTHDNNTAAGWMHDGDPEAVGYADEYLGLNAQEGLHWGIIRGGMSSVAELFIAQMQDYLGLGAQARMNTPSTLGGNWQWRMLPGEADAALSEKIARYTKMYGRG